MRQFAFVAIAFALICAGCGQGSDQQVNQPLSPSPSPPKTLIAVGDIAMCGATPAAESAAARTAGLMKSIMATLAETPPLLTLGDNVYNVGSAAEFQSCYEPTWGPFKSHTWATPGNHDYGTANGQDYYDYFGTAAGPDRRGFYSQTLNGWTIVSLNSNIDTGLGSTQYRWLQQVLAASTESCVLAAWHYPLFSSSARGNNPTMAEIFALLTTYRTDLVLQGHEHHFEQFAPMLFDGQLSDTGITTLVVGTGGAPLYPFATNPRVGSLTRIAQFGVLRLDLQPGSATWQFIGLDHKPLATGQIACKPKRSS
jgi:acid phosphatase type 7